MRTDTTFDRRQVRCPNARSTGYSVPVARVGHWVTWAYPQGPMFTGRMVGRIVRAPKLSGDEVPIAGWLLVLTLSTEMTHAYERWVNPEWVTEVHPNAPDIQKFLHWFAGPVEAQPVEWLRKAANHGTLSANQNPDQPSWDFAGKLERFREFWTRWLTGEPEPR